MAERLELTGLRLAPIHDPTASHYRLNAMVKIGNLTEVARDFDPFKDSLELNRNLQVDFKKSEYGLELLDKPKDVAADDYVLQGDQEAEAGRELALVAPQVEAQMRAAQSSEASVQSMKDLVVKLGDLLQRDGRGALAKFFNP